MFSHDRVPADTVRPESLPRSVGLIGLCFVSDRKPHIGGADQPEHDAGTTRRVLSDGVECAFAPATPARTTTTKRMSTFYRVLASPRAMAHGEHAEYDLLGRAAAVHPVDLVHGTSTIEPPSVIAVRRPLAGESS